MTMQTATPIEVDADDLPPHCPTAKTPAWNYHPRMFLDTVDIGEAKRPCCGTVYKLILGVELKGHR